jgi:hypothetical protein
MTITEKQDDIFNAPRGQHIVHCISGDFTLGAGLAKKIDDVYNMRYKLFKTYPYEDGKNYGYVGKALLIDDVFNLVNKPKFKHKPRIEDLRNALEDLRDQCEEKGIHKIAMPKIGTGHDHMNWDDVLTVIEEVFDDTDIDIDVYYLR